SGAAFLALLAALFGTSFIVPNLISDLLYFLSGAVGDGACFDSSVDKVLMQRARALDRGAGIRECARTALVASPTAPATTVPGGQKILSLRCG
ncbi:MAG: hypothetical protein ACXWC3_31145, partial [Burkholderiales bacterium]